MKVQVLYQNLECFTWVSCNTAGARGLPSTPPSALFCCLAEPGLLHSRLSIQARETTSVFIAGWAEH